MAALNPSTPDSRTNSFLGFWAFAVLARFGRYNKGCAGFSAESMGFKLGPKLGTSSYT